MLKSLLIVPAILFSNTAVSLADSTQHKPKTYLLKFGASVYAIRAEDGASDDISKLELANNCLVIPAPKFDGVELDSMALLNIAPKPDIGDLIKDLLGSDARVKVVPLDKAKVSTQDAIVDPN